jgi:hypothetical protein
MRSRKIHSVTMEDSLNPPVHHLETLYRIHAFVNPRLPFGAAPSTPRLKACRVLSDQVEELFTAVTRVQIPSGTPNLINELATIALERGPIPFGFRVRGGDSCQCFLGSPRGILYPLCDFQHGFILAVEIRTQTSARWTVPSNRRITRAVRHHTRNSFSSRSAAGLPKRRVVRRNSSKSRG